jgi:predicted nucleotidyltransferase
VRIHTSLDPAQSCAIGNVQITGVPTRQRSSPHLWERWRIIATPIVHAEYEGLRVTPNVYTTLDTFAAMEEIAMEEWTRRKRVGRRGSQRCARPSRVLFGAIGLSGRS